MHAASTMSVTQSSNHALQELPKLLYYLGASSPGTSATALRMLHNAGRFCRPGDPVAAALDGLQPEMVPLFCRPGMPAKGLGAKAKGAAGGKDAGKLSTFAQLPASCQVGLVHMRVHSPVISALCKS